ncbi:MAG: hypothetical protein JWR40_1454 [Massilia sp.]|jgi:hypothetical protein|nr:hypothetical protein [Massilia sp.]
MNIAPTPIHAPASVRFRGRQAFVRALVLGCAVACAAMPAFAGQDREHDRDQRNSQQQHSAQPNRDAPPPRAERGPPQQQRADPRQGDSRANDEQRRQAQQQAQQQSQQQDQGGRRGGRLTPDERRELRRQINEAGVELYPNTPRR